MKPDEEVIRTHLKLPMCDLWDLFVKVVLNRELAPPHHQRNGKLAERGEFTCKVYHNDQSRDEVKRVVNFL